MFNSSKNNVRVLKGDTSKRF